MIGNPLYEVLFCDTDDERNSLISLPFAPFPGLELQAPWDSDNWHAIDEVFWEKANGRFVIYAKRDAKA